MRTKVKVIKIHFSTWRKLRGLIKAKRGESFSAYLDRVVYYLDNSMNIFGKDIRQAVKQHLKEERGTE